MTSPTVLLTSSLQKVLPGADPEADLRSLSGWKGERLSFQIAWRPQIDGGQMQTPLRVEIDGGAASLFAVDLVPVQVPCWPVHSDGYLVEEPGLLPDILRGFAPGEPIRPTHTGWHSVWVDVVPSGDLHVRVINGDDVVLEQDIPVHLVERELAKPDVTFTQWFHADSLAAYYGVEAWSEGHWAAIESQVRSAARMGVTMLLTPVWTPPLDTEVGANRRAMQLLDIAHDGTAYRFGTERLDRWIGILEAAGIRQIEVPPLFTQWGAEAAPQIWVEVDGVAEQRFGWHTPATDPAYADLLGQMLPFLRSHLDARVGLDNVIFHVSDEPTDQNLATYTAALDVVSGLLEGVTVVDALSHAEFADYVPRPVVATDAVGNFRAIGTEPDWVYYCVGQSWDVSNRFIAQAAVRTRALGWQMYKAGATGFLHWGFNFYLTQLSTRDVNPYVDTSAGGNFLSGDSFIVYPGGGFETVESLRHRLFSDALGDLAAAQQAERILGRDAVLAVIDPDGDLDYATGWVDGATWLERRAALDEAVQSAIA